MVRRGFDRGVAAAEARLERLDDRIHEDGGESSESLLIGDASSLSDDDALHIQEDWFADATEDDIPDPADHGQTDLADCIDTFAEAFNARDLDGLLELVAEDCETPGLGNDLAHLPAAIEDLWERRPTVLLTRGGATDTPVGVLWELGEEDGWWPLATVHLSDVVDGSVGVVAFSTDPTLLDDVAGEAPDLEFEEGTRWVEWDEGATE